MRLGKGALNVRFGSLADILRRGSDVRFTPKSGHQAARSRSNVISATFNVEFHFDAFGPRVGYERRRCGFAYLQLGSDVSQCGA
jgi:hypothetical protein